MYAWGGEGKKEARRHIPILLFRYGNHFEAFGEERKRNMPTYLSHKPAIRGGTYMLLYREYFNCSLAILSFLFVIHGIPRLV